VTSAARTSLPGLGSSAIQRIRDRSFKSKALRLFAETGDGRKLSVPNARRVQRILKALDVAKAPEDMNLLGYRSTC
jgi:plasmid maintenance system killer protein